MRAELAAGTAKIPRRVEAFLDLLGDAVAPKLQTISLDRVRVFFLI